LLAGEVQECTVCIVSRAWRNEAVHGAGAALFCHLPTTYSHVNTPPGADTACILHAQSKKKPHRHTCTTRETGHILYAHNLDRGDI